MTMAPRIIDCEQGTPEWFAARLGIPTASEFSTVLAKGKDGGKSLTRKTYMLKLAGEILTGEPMEAYSNQHMERGKEQEAEAREAYELMKDIDCQRVGFIRNGDKGCSPDSLIGEDGGLEIKTALPHIQVERLLKGDLPAEHRAQVQGSMWVAERQWWDFVSYCPRLPLLIVRVPRDDGYIATLAGAVKEFNAELANVVDAIRTAGGLTEQLKRSAA
ncbi:lambda exonuclease family protein [Bradyrhizobium ottawaense]|uniref:lambda exonuclease family protein n=1 Tax=Bradyrhizobium ottawaense TaxID=931866 RepID=UPI001FDFC9B0|nr:lambda exonuclease family protein [Bradyrhizobium ottawaense]